jgi:hypothetical protein
MMQGGEKPEPQNFYGLETAKASRLSAMKLAGDPNNPAHFKDDATADELRAEITRRLNILQNAGILELQVIESEVQ